MRVSGVERKRIVDSTSATGGSPYGTYDAETDAVSSVRRMCFNGTWLGLNEYKGWRGNTAGPESEDGIKGRLSLRDRTIREM